MRWYEADAYKSVQIGEDELHNPICHLEKAFTFSIRIAPFIPTHDQTEGNKFDLVSRTFFTRLLADKFDGVTAVGVNGQMYAVDDVMKDGSHTALRVRCAK